MSCALASPVSGVCANKRPVKGRGAAARPGAPLQATLHPLAIGHARIDAPAAVGAAAAPRVVPFGADDPEANFSVTEVTAPVAHEALHSPPVAPLQPVAAGRPPSFREIRAAAARIEGGEELLVEIAPEPDPEWQGMALTLPGMDGLVERVRRRTAARLSRGGVVAAH